MAKVLITESILEDTADAIREKTGSVDTMKPSEFAENISDIPQGADLSEYFTATISEGTNNNPGFRNMVKYIPSTTTVSGNSLSYAFQKYIGTTIPLINTSSVTNMNDMFRDCPNLTTIPLLITSSVTNMAGMFYLCRSFTTLPLIDTSSVTNMNNMCNGCINLTTIPLLNTSSVETMTNMFSSCSNLTDTSLDNILQMCVGATSYTGTKTLATLGFNATNYPATRIQALPHYQNFIDAGWTIGY